MVGRLRPGYESVRSGGLAHELRTGVADRADLKVRWADVIAAVRRNDRQAVIDALALIYDRADKYELAEMADRYLDGARR